VHCVLEDTERREGEQMNKGRNKGQRAELDSGTAGQMDSRTASDSVP